MSDNTQEDSDFEWASGTLPTVMPEDAARMTLTWDERFQQLLRFYLENQNACVPKAHGSLGRWVARQRELKKVGRLHPDREKKLLELSFVWNTNESAWEEKFQQLLVFRCREGHCCVPTGNGHLGMWTAKQRQLHRQGRLTQVRIDRLNAVGFVWSTSTADWDEKFDALVEYKKHHGHTNVPLDVGPLGWWVRAQKLAMRRDKLAQERRDALEGIGFIWEPQRRDHSNRSPASPVQSDLSIEDDQVSCPKKCPESPNSCFSSLSESSASLSSRMLPFSIPACASPNLPSSVFEEGAPDVQLSPSKRPKLENANSTESPIEFEPPPCFATVENPWI
mmetsp:Transcript_15915/g.31973  ORF Transcript_15915/g.31973 Transcript_15915/m.31973 type:complete len:335 (+) Transcript_15915:1791-2795(+)